MPGRDIRIINGGIYHILNRGVGSQKIFSCDRDYLQFIERIKYYQNKNLNFSYSKLKDLALVEREGILSRLFEKKDYLAVIIAYCLMPNHFHFILKQISNDGIAKFISDLTNSYTRYYNVKKKRIGPIFQGKFKAVDVLHDEQLLHLSRYIHLNPYSAGIVGDVRKLLQYPYSSLAEYITDSKGLCQKEIVLDQFSSKSSYKQFVLDNADYQLSLQVIKKQVLDS